MIRMKQSNVTGPMDKAEAQAITDRIRNAVDQLWSLLLEAHDRRAWRALGHTSWEAYVTTEFGMTRQHSYRLLDQGRVIHAIEEAAGKVSPSGDISEAAARDIKSVLPEVKAEIKQRIEAGENPETVVKETVDAAREAKAKAKAEREAQQAEHDRQREEARAALPDRIRQREEAKAQAIADRKNDGSQENPSSDGLSPEDRIAELEESVRVLEAEVEELRAENKLYGEMKVQFAQGGFEKVIADKDEEIRVANARKFQESADKASWMKSAKAWKKRAEELGWSDREVIDIEAGEVANG